MLAFLLGILSAALRLSASLRLSDAERGRAIERLKGHYAEGLLPVEELEARVEGVLRSGSSGGIVTHFRDLPLRGARQLIVGAVRRFQRVILRMHFLTYATANAALVGVWALTGQGVFWPAWFLVPSTALLGWHALISRRLSRALNRASW